MTDARIAEILRLPHADRTIAIRVELLPEVLDGCAEKIAQREQAHKTMSDKQRKDLIGLDQLLALALSGM